MTKTEPTISALAPAKINLTLRITGRREDGYHLLDSLVAFTDFGDLLHISPANDVTLSVDGPFAAHVPEDGDNIIMMAANALRARISGPLGATIRLTKNLPVASGIGGGSSDAAAALRVLKRLWNADLPDHELADIGLALGADVPVCLAGRPCRMRGIGEDVEPISLSECGIVLVNPLTPCSTAAVFRRYSGGSSAKVASLPKIATTEQLAGVVSSLGNDLAESAISECPAIDSILSDLRAVAGVRAAGMSGSGATCFALFDDATAAHEAARFLRGIDGAETRWIEAGLIGDA